MVYITTIFFAVLGLTMCFFVFPKRVIKLIANKSPEVLFSINTSDKKIALTLDDAPHQVLTPKILDVLAKFHAHATFFIIGDQIDGNEQITQRILDEGHEIGNHMMHESASYRLSEEAFGEQLLAADIKLKKYADVQWFRPGSGIYHKQMLRQIKRHGYRCALGNIVPLDWIISNAKLISWYIVTHASAGDIIILHDGRLVRKYNVKVLEYCLEKLTNSGFQIVSLSGLCYQSN